MNSIHRMEQAQRVLEEVFGFEQFRPLQGEVIERVLEKRDALVVMPTGGGKSLCYQIPALVFEGLTVVLSPLISLMKDQVDQLCACGVEAVYLNSALTPEEFSYQSWKVSSGQARLLYVSPEGLFTPRIQELLQSRNVECVAIDEAHCISQWGHDFRPEYRQLSSLRESFPQAVYLALTATATPRVREDIQRSLMLEDPQSFISSFDRPNLFLEVVPKIDLLPQIMEILQKHPQQSGLVYCFSRRQVESVAANLSRAGIRALPYHAGLEDDVRSANQDAFLCGSCEVIVATVAFGMGIDKPDIRFVIHVDLPASIEHYYQEIGRAGRDGMPAHCRFLHSHGDRNKRIHFLEEKEGTEKQVGLEQLQSMIRWAESPGCRRVPLLSYFGERRPESNCGQCDRCVQGDREEDLTVAAQKFLSCVRRTREIFGEKHIIDVLLGSKNKRVLERNHDQLTTYGIGTEYSRKQWKALSHQFLSEGLMKRDPEYGGLSLTPLAWEVFRGERQVMGAVPTAPEREQEATDYDGELFSLLRELRTRLATEAGIPSYAVFSDRSLMEMATYYPQSTDSFLQVHGVGKAKCASFGEDFLSVIREYCQGSEIEERPMLVHSSLPTRASDKTPRHVEVGEAFQEGESVQGLIERMGVQEKTILNHLLSYLQDGYALRTDGLLEYSRLSEELQQRVFEAFEERSAEKLAPVRELVGPQVSYDELRLLRLVYLARQSSNRLEG